MLCDCKPALQQIENAHRTGMPEGLRKIRPTLSAELEEGPLCAEEALLLGRKRPSPFSNSGPTPLRSDPNLEGLKV